MHKNKRFITKQNNNLKHEAEIYRIGCKNVKNI